MAERFWPEKGGSESPVVYWFSLSRRYEFVPGKYRTYARVLNRGKQGVSLHCAKSQPRVPGHRDFASRRGPVKPQRRPAHNHLLAALPDRERVHLETVVTRERGELKQLLCERGQPIKAVYFPIDSVVSVLTALSDHDAVEIATVGNEGMVGSHLLLGSRSTPAQEFAQVQVPGDLLRMDADDFLEELAKDGPFREVVQRYIQVLFSQISQQVACNGVHSINERCSRWLLLTHDRVASDDFPLTQEFLSQMLGVRRASVTLAAGALQHAGFIRYRHGRMTILDREGLEGTSCECYRIIRREFDRLLGEQFEHGERALKPVDEEQDPAG